MKEKSNKGLILTVLGILIIAVGSLLCLIVTNKKEEEKPKEKTVIITASDITKAINKLDNEGATEYYYTPYIYLTKSNKNIEADDLYLYTKLYVANKFEYNYIDVLNKLFNESYTEDKLKENEEIANLIQINDGHLDFDLSYSEWDKGYHKIYDTIEANNKLEIYEYVVYSYGGTPDNENIYKYYKLDYDRNEYNIPVNDDDLIVSIDNSDENTKEFNIDDYKDQVTKVKWTFTKDSNGSYVFTSIEIVE